MNPQAVKQHNKARARILAARGQAVEDKIEEHQQAAPDPFDGVDLTKLPKKELQNIADKKTLTYNDKDTKATLITLIEG